MKRIIIFIGILLCSMASISCTKKDGSCGPFLWKTDNIELDFHQNTVYVETVSPIVLNNYPDYFYTEGKESVIYFQPDMPIMSGTFKCSIPHHISGEWYNVTIPAVTFNAVMITIEENKSQEARSFTLAAKYCGLKKVTITQRGYTSSK